MRLSRKFAVLVLAGLSASLSYADKNPADYPLRLHIFQRGETSFYHRESLDQTQGQGRGDLFTDDDVRGVDFNFYCSEKIRASFGTETYRARWRKPGRVLTVLFPEFGKTGSYFTCDLNTDVKDYAYVHKKGGLTMEPSSEFKAWMVRHDYDPVHGKDVPQRASGEAPASPNAEP